MSDFRIDKITNRTGDTGPQICGVSTFSGTSGMAMPSGPTENRGGRGRGLFAGGYTPSSPNLSNVIDMIEIATTGNATDFGDIAHSGNTGSSSNSIRGVFNYCHVPSSLTTMNYTVISSSGGVADFGDLSYVTRDGPYGGGDNTRGVLGGSAGGPSNMGGSPGRGVNYIDYITFATTGDSQNFGTLTVARRGMGACSSPTRTVFGGGYIKPQSHTKVIDVVTTQTKGDSIKFGELTVSRGHMGACSSTTRGIWYGGSIYPGSDVFYNVIDYITIASDGNATDFGDTMTAGGIHFTTGTASNQTRGVWAGGATPAYQDDIAYVTIATTGNAVDFGNLTSAQVSKSGASDNHGGLG